MADNLNNTVYVIGHKNPDTDSICSAICYAELNNKISDKHFIPMRCGDINSETEFVLNYFNTELPDYVDNVYTQVNDVEYRHTKGVSDNISIKSAWEIIAKDKLTTLPVVDEEDNLKGIITIKDIAMSYMEVYDNYILSTASTPYSNVIDTLNGEMIAGNTDDIITKGKVLIAAANPDLMEAYIEKNDIVILGNRYEAQLCAIEMGAQCIIVCDGSPVSHTITNLAKERSCTVISTFYDTFTAARLINQSIPIRHFMKTNNLITFSNDELIKDIRSVMAKYRYQYYPVLNDSGKYTGLISQRNYLNANPKKVILVDHNERSQAVDGIDEAELLEIIDHHRLGGIQTMNPISFRNQPLGCTATIIYTIYTEKNVEISPKIAGLLCAAIISDTLMFRSPTCTDYDKATCEKLAETAGIDILEFATELFKAGSNLGNKTEEEIFHQDYKVFSAHGIKFSVGQITILADNTLNQIKSRMINYMKSAYKSSGTEMLFLMLTNIITESTTLLYYSEKDGMDSLVTRAFGVPAEDNSVLLTGVVSRKKQVVPELIKAINQVF